MKAFIGKWFIGPSNATNGAVLVFFSICILVVMIAWVISLELDYRPMVVAPMFLLFVLVFLWILNGQSFEWSAAIAAWLNK